MSFRSIAYLALMALAGCAATIPKAEVDRCSRGVADGNDAYRVGQGAACRMVAQRLAQNDQATEALGFARKSCQLEDARGCEEYLALVRAQPSLRPDELQGARAAGEKACAGIVVASDGADARPVICAGTAELYLDVEPRSPTDAGRLYARACGLGDDKSCTRAKSLGVDPGASKVAAGPKEALPALPPQPLPRPTTSPPVAATAPPAPACHEMRTCVTLEVKQRNTSEVVGTITNHCDRPVQCTWCASRGDQVDKAKCASSTLGPNESKTGRESGLWFEGYTAMAYDCSDASDDRRCNGL
jgi:hypothetical protein